MELDFGLTKIIKAILNDEHEILTISTFLNGEYGKHDISIGVPAIVNSKGVQEILQIELTKEGENIATKYLENLGYTIIERNFMARQGEIDIIAKDKEEYVFIEVKTRSSNLFGEPIEAVNKPKQKHLINTVKYYIYLNQLENEFIRLDVIEVYLKEKSYKINHIKQII